MSQKNSIEDVVQKFASLRKNNAECNTMMLGFCKLFGYHSPRRFNALLQKFSNYCGIADVIDYETFLGSSLKEDEKTGLNEEHKEQELREFIHILEQA